MTKDSKDWWRGAVIYQIYPRSFHDTNNDGVGDLRGITEKMDYLAQLGIDAIWISPFFKSPMKDFGYDVSDYEAVDPLFGTMEDFDKMIETAHAKGIKIMIDQVISHTSDQHEWFKESRSSKDNPKADWYVWADAKPDGTAPNNWMSYFGGPAWQWDTRRQQYYMHNFLASQPDVNFHNPQVRQALLDSVEFWLKKGVDGFRLDTVDMYYCDKELRSNPPRPPGVIDGIPESNPYSRQQHIYDRSRPENLTFLEDFRKLTDRYENITTVGELGAENALDLMADYTKKDKRLHMAYTFPLLGDKFSAAHVRQSVEYMEAHIQDGWACWAFTNHDIVRVVSRWGKGKHNDRFAKMLIALMSSLRGSVCMYQGEELGLTEADVPYEKLQDPYGIEFWPEFKGRDGCRTPMPWQADKPNAGFSVKEPWLPVPKDHLPLAADAQEKNKDSVLNFTRQFFKWRKTQPALMKGDIKFYDAPEPIVAFTRNWEGKTLLCVFNLGLEELSYKIPLSGTVKHVQMDGFACMQENNMLHLPPYSAFFATVE
ncbi:MAG TPA: alpha-glucosidase [Rickettsiales bacterium]|nr:alpha-glucosidase [Rickettsiales bacterium]